MTCSIINSIPVICIIAASYVTQIAGARNGICPDPARGEIKRYSVASEVCCGGNIYQVGRGVRPLCCGDGIYSPRDEICCGGEVKSRSEGEQCCGFSQWYDPDTSICCGNHVHSSRNGLFECCGSTKYNTAVDTCCQVEEGDGGIAMATLPGVGQCCGNTVIDPRHEICCNGMAHGKTDSLTQCCGNSTYNRMTEMCCDNHLPYNPHSQLCCDGNVYTADEGAKCCGSESYLASQSSCCHSHLFRGIPEMPNVQACCGDVSFFKTNNICCQGTLYERGENVACCGHDTYNSSTELCCGYADESTAILEKASTSAECCGLSTYDPTSQTCCEMASRSFDGVVGGECCGTDPDHVRAYDPNQATCCRGREGEFLHNIPTGQAQCCDSNILLENELCDPLERYPVEKNVDTDDAICYDVTYNTATQVCMEDGIIEVLSRNLAVCGIELYDPTAEVCCDDFIRGRFDEDGHERECCPGTTISYKPALQTCCMATVHDIPSAESGCCRNTAYSTLTHMCDQRGIIRLLAEVDVYPELCGNTPYHPDEYVCCGQKLLGADQICCMGYPAPLRQGSETGECCGLYAFDPTTQVCCSGNVNMMASSDATCCGYDLLTSPERQICCDGYLHERDGGRDECHGHTAFNPDTETVCNGWVFDLPNGDCCSGQAYQAANKICCNGELHTRTSEMTECCGSQIYETDDSMTICCNGHLSQEEAELECCGDMTYDPLTETCCMNDLLPFTQSRMAEKTISCCNTGNYQSSQHTCCGGVEHKFISGGECCGVDIIRNPDEEICCGGIVWSKYAGENVECCGGELIDNRYQTCCNGVTLYPGEARECCDGSVINTYIHTCCGGEVLMNDNQIGCCDGTSFSTAEQGCCDTQIFNASTEMCSESNIITPLNPESSISYVAETANNGASLLFFCDEQEYDALTQTCCGNFVFDLRDDFICCNGQPSDASSGKTSCCVDTPYNPTRFECCQGDLHHKVDGAQCCGASYYQPSKEACSDDHTVSLRGEGYPNTLPVSQDSQCLCSLKHRSDPISSACTDRIRTMQRIFIATVVDAEMEDGSRSYFIEPFDALRGALPLAPEDANGSLELVMSNQIGCNAPSLRRGQKVAVFIDSRMGLEDSTLQLTRSDVIIPYTRRLVRKINSFL